jgi:DNA-binding NarL/FixJ family response regulator
MKLCVMYDPDVDELPVLPDGMGVCGIGWIAQRDGAAALVEALAPRIVLMDLRRHGERIGTHVRRIREVLREVRILVLGPRGDLGAAEAAMHAGAAGYITRPANLFVALRSLDAESMFITETGRSAISRRLTGNASRNSP